MFWRGQQRNKAKCTTHVQSGLCGTAGTCKYQSGMEMVNLPRVPVLDEVRYLRVQKLVEVVTTGEKEKKKEAKQRRRRRQRKRHFKI